MVECWFVTSQAVKQMCGDMRFGSVTVEEGAGAFDDVDVMLLLRRIVGGGI